ncbi:MAG: hypothetical protein KC931_17235, partial [Candidatus Omnitrophica bacterium]|nr:hypothetical protein [Candidatus Omnitrophota bacterium]
MPAPFGKPSLSNYERTFERVWIDHKTGWDGAYLHPSENMHNYGREISLDTGIASLVLMLDYPQEQKETLLIRYLQTGIDLYGILDNGGGWSADGGHASGRKWPIIMAGLLLERTDMAEIGMNYGPSSFGEDCQTYYDNQNYPRWGIRHCQDPTKESYNDESNPYRTCCTSNTWPPSALSAMLMGARELWNHEAFFDYVDRWVAAGGSH